MKTFKYQFTKLMKALIFCGMALAGVAFGMNVYQMIKIGLGHSANATYGIIQYAMMFLLPIILLAILISVLVSSSYSLDGNYITTKFGFIKSKYSLNDVESITLNKNNDKLTLTFENGARIVIVVNESQYEEVVDSIRKGRAKISYEVISKTEKKK